jgi:hypothetical protein
MSRPGDADAAMSTIAFSRGSLAAIIGAMMPPAL